MRSAIPRQSGGSFVQLSSCRKKQTNKQTNKQANTLLQMINARLIGKLHTKVIGDWLVLYAQLPVACSTVVTGSWAGAWERG